MYAARVLKWDTSHGDETLSRNKIDFKDANMGLAGRGGHITHVTMSWTHVHNAVEMSRYRVILISPRSAPAVAFSRTEAL